MSMMEYYKKQLIQMSNHALYKKIFSFSTARLCLPGPNNNFDGEANLDFI